MTGTGPTPAELGIPPTTEAPTTEPGEIKFDRRHPDPRKSKKLHTELAAIQKREMPPEWFKDIKPDPTPAATLRDAAANRQPSEPEPVPNFGGKSQRAFDAEAAKKDLGHNVGSMTPKPLSTPTK